MNDKQKLINDILDIVVSECTMEIDGKQTVTRESVIGRSKDSNVAMSRCIFATEVLFAGFSKSTLALFLNGRSTQAVSDMLKVAHQLRITSPAYRVAEAKCTIKCKELIKF